MVMGRNIRSDGKTIRIYLDMYALHWTPHGYKVEPIFLAANVVVTQLTVYKRPTSIRGQPKENKKISGTTRTILAILLHR